MQLIINNYSYYSMKKITFLTLLFAIFCVQGMVAQEQEITYVEDPAQGYLFNKFKDNWFITGEGGVNIYFSPNDVHRDVKDRFSPAAGLYAGKWFSPLIGVRAGVNWLKTKGLSEVGVNEPMVNGEYKQQFSHVGPVFDVMLNMTNWICGYKPGRKYNLSVYAGGGCYFTYVPDYKANGEQDGWKHVDDEILTFRAGIINSFNVSDQVQLSLDIRYSALDNHEDEVGTSWNKSCSDLQAYLGVTYLFKKREWNAPIVPVCPEPENCDALRARLQAADAKIAELEQQLKACLERPVETIVEEAEKAPLATIYYPINVSKLTKKDINILNAVAEVMKSNPDQKYLLTGWADNYTGNDQINTRLRKNRVAGVEKQLLKIGVPAEQLESTISAENLVDLGEKYQALGRAVTIEEAE